MIIACVLSGVLAVIMTVLYLLKRGELANERRLWNEKIAIKDKLAEEARATSERLLQESKQTAEKQAADIREGYERQITEIKENFSESVRQEREALNERFKSLATDILHSNSKQLDEHSRLSLEAVLGPVKTRLEEFTKGFQECYGIENRDRLSLREEIKNLHELNTRVGRETARLADALKGNTRVQGDWGEMVLTNILEHSGLQRGRWFVTQETSKDDGGSSIRPDAVIHCPKERDIIIDSKASLSSYLSMLEADDEATRERLIEAHVRSVENHISILRKKEYQDKIGAKKGDFVLMFMPHEGAYLAAMNAKPDLWEKAYNSHVIMVSPTHLVTVVRLVEQMWQTEDQTVNSEKIAEEGSKLLESLNGFMSELSSVGDILEKASKTYENALKKLSTGNNNVVRVATRLKSLGVKAKKEIPQKLLETSSELGFEGVETATEGDEITKD